MRSALWKGRSGTRYPAEILSLAEARESGERDAIGLGIGRDSKGIGHPITQSPRITLAWLARAATARVMISTTSVAVSEIHVVETTREGRLAAFEDLRGEP